MCLAVLIHSASQQAARDRRAMCVPCCIGISAHRGNNPGMPPVWRPQAPTKTLAVRGAYQLDFAYPVRFVHHSQLLK